MKEENRVGGVMGQNRMVAYAIHLYEQVREVRRD